MKRCLLLLSFLTHICFNCYSIEQSTSFFTNEIEKPDGVILKQIFNEKGLLLAVESSDGAVIYHFEYDADDRLVKATDCQTEEVTLRCYHTHGVKEQLQNGLTVACFCNTKGQRTKLLLPDNSSIVYEYKENCLNSIRRLGKNGQEKFRYASEYLREKSENKVVIRDINNEKLINSDDYIFDLNGNLIEKRINGYTHVLYTYDPFNRLKDVIYPNELKISYFYDPFHRRISREKAIWEVTTSSWHPVCRIRYLYDGYQEIGLIDQEGNIEELRILGLGANEEAAIAIELKQKIYIPKYDFKTGSVASLQEIGSTQIAEQYVYPAFGKDKIFDQSMSAISKTALGNFWRYQSQRVDEETDVLFYGRRYYCTNCECWIASDSLIHVDEINKAALIAKQPKKEDEPNSDRTLFQTLKKAYFRVSEWILGKKFMETAVYHQYEGNNYLYGQGEVNDKVRITLINGMLSEYHYILDSAKLLSECHGNVNIHFIYVSTYGFLHDVARAIPVKVGYVSPFAAELVALWRNLIEEMGGIKGGGTIIHYAHSIGAAETEIALAQLTAKEQNMIKVYTFGSPSVVLKSNCQHLTNFVSIRDGICLLDPLGIVNATVKPSDQVIFTGSWKGWPLIDHLFLTESYQQIWRELGKTFTETYMRTAEPGA